MGGKKQSFEERHSTEAENLKLIQELEKQNKELRQVVERAKHAEKALKESEKKFRTVIEDAVEIVFTIDTQGYFTYVNPAGLKSSGYELNELTKLKYTDLIEPKYKHRVKRNYIKQFIKKEELSTTEFPYKTKSGEIKWYNQNARLITEGDELNGFFVIARDVTERRKIEEELKESEKKYSSLFNSMNEGVVLHEVVYNEKNEAIDYRILESNPSFEKHTGFNYEKSFNQLASKFYNVPIAPYLDIYSRVAETGIPTHFEAFFPPLEKHFDISVFSPKKRMFATIFTDISERKKSEEALRESKQLIERIINAITVRVFWKDKNLVYLGCNEIFARDAGFYKPEDIIGKDDFQMGWRNQAEIYRSDDRQVIDSGTPKINIEEPQTTPDGKTITLLTNKIPLLDKEGNVNGVLGTYMDITERKQIEILMQEQKEEIQVQNEELNQTNEKLYQAKEKAEESRVRLHTLINAIPDLIWLKDVEGIYLQCNKRFEDFFGASENEIVGKTDYDFVDKKLADLFREHDKKAMLTNAPTINEEQIIFANDGHKEYLETIKTPLSDINKNIIGVLGIGRDITQRIIAEKELVKAKEKAEESESKYRGIYNNLPVGIFRSTLPGKILSVNPSFLKIYGFNNLEEVQNTQAQEYYTTKSDREKMISILKEKGVAKDFITKEKKKDGSEIWVETNYSAIKNEKGEIEFIDGIVEDKTARIEAENKVTEYKKRLQISLETTHASVFENNLKTGELICTPELFQHFGYQTKQIPTTSEEFVALIHPEDVLKLSDELQNHFEGKSSEYYVEYRIKDAEGNWRWIDGKGNVVRRDKKGIPITFIGISRDISDRKHIELELIKAKEKAEESDRLKSAFLANMSHEIRTPMNGILGFANLLKEPKLTGEELQSYVDVIEKSGERMLNIINDIINISKIESGQMEVSVSETNINEQIEYIYTFFKPEAEQKGIQLYLKNTLPSTESIIKADREKVYAIFTNLVKNALKFTSEGFIEMGYERKGGYLEFFVKDTGTGIPQDQQEIIFERFRQGSDSLKRDYEGSGLGLSITKAYVELMGGKIWVESETNEKSKGTSFYFTLPYITNKKEPILVKKSDSGNKMEEFTDHKKPGFKILIVEDDQPSEMLISIAVQSIAKEIIKVKTGLEAVEACRQNKDIDVVLMDIQMPQMDGYEATRQIREFNKEVIIIAQTAFGFSNDKDKVLEAGCNGYISKPLIKEDLLNLIKVHIKDWD